MNSTQTTQTASRRLVTQNRLCRYSAAQQTPTLLTARFHSQDQAIALAQITRTPTLFTAETISHLPTAQLGGTVSGCPPQALALPQCSEALASKMSWDIHTSTVLQTPAVLSAPASGTIPPPAPAPSTQAWSIQKNTCKTPHKSWVQLQYQQYRARLGASPKTVLTQQQTWVSSPIQQSDAFHSVGVRCVTVNCN